MQSLTALYYAGLKTVGWTAAARRMRHGGLILCYHNVVAAPRDPLVGDPAAHMSLDQFREQMEWLTANYNVVPLAEFVDRVVGARSLRRTATITFDDAYTGMLAHALPVLKRLGLSATVFVVSEAAERSGAFWWDHPKVLHIATPARRKRWLGGLQGDRDAVFRDVGVLEDGPTLPADYLPANWEALTTAVHSGVALGVHSATHRTLPGLTDDALKRELAASGAAVELRTGTKPLFFAHPYGLWDARVREAVRDAGYRAACTLDYGLVRPGNDPWALPRINIPATISGPAFQAWSTGLALRRFVPW